MTGADRGAPREPGRDPLPSWRPQPDGEASWTDVVDGTGDSAGARQGEQTPQGPPASDRSQDFSFIEVSGGEPRAVVGSCWGGGGA